MSPQGLSYDYLSVTATRSDGSPVANFDPLCVTMPVLLGSVVVETRTIETPLGVKVTATYDAAQVSFYGTDGASSYAKTVSADSLSGGYDQDVDVRSSDGNDYVIHLSSTCTN
jgi:hypothetical protein